MESYRLAVAAIVLFGLITFPLLLRIPAPYGRHVREGFGPRISARWGWIVMESASPISFAIVFLMSSDAAGPLPFLFMALWLTHYGYRSVVYPLRVRGERKQMTLLAAALAVVFNVVNGSANAYGVTRAASHLDTAWLADPRFAAGLVLFFAGMTMHLHSDAILRGLRAPGETGYRIPHGGLFRWVSCPNYLGEWIQWCGFALAAWTPAAAAFAFFTFANLAPRARAHHHWYRREFPEYPSDRRALVPGVW